MIVKLLRKSQLGSCSYKDFFYLLNSLSGSRKMGDVYFLISVFKYEMDFTFVLVIFLYLEKGGFSINLDFLILFL